MTFIPVTDITNFRPTQAIIGQEVELHADVAPGNATNQTIEWSLVRGNATIIPGTNKFIGHSSELVTVMATIRNGKQQ